MCRYADELATYRHPLGEEEFVFCLLFDLDEDFDSMVYLFLWLTLRPYLQLSYTHRCSVRSFDLTITQVATQGFYSSANDDDCNHGGMWT
jgi:hypothetical protein